MSSHDFLRKQATGYRVTLLILAIIAMVLAAVNYKMLDENFVNTNFQTAVAIFTLTAVFGFLCLGILKEYVKVRRSTVEVIKAGTSTEASDRKKK